MMKSIYNYFDFPEVAEAHNITKDIDKINSKIQTCKRIIATAEKGEKENFLIKKRVEDNRLKSKKEIAKNKDKKRIR